MKTSQVLAQLRSGKPSQAVVVYEPGSSPAIFTRAAAMLAEADTIQKAKDLKNLAITAAEWAKRKGMGEKAIQHCLSYARRAKERLGELLRAAEKNRGSKLTGAGPGRGKKRRQPAGTTVLDTAPTLFELGISKKESAEAQMLADLPPEEFEDFVAGKTTMVAVKRNRKEKKREQRRAANRKIVETTPGADVVAAGAKFATIVIDPPWDWGDEGDQDQLGRAKPEYATMSIDQLMKLPVSELADDDCHLYLWITNRSLPKGFGLIEKWGFRYVTMLTWVKPSYGMGNYFRGQTEHVLFAVRGSQMLKRKDVGTVFSAPRGKEHSSKPAEFYAIAESCSPGPYLEMFARSERKEWTAWGAEAGNREVA